MWQELDMRHAAIAMTLSLAAIAGCANSHEGEGDAGGSTHPDVGPILVLDTGAPTPCGPTTCAVGRVCCNASCGICTAPGEGCIDLDCADAGPAPQVCGGFGGLPCAPTEYCDYPAGSACGGDDSTGLCRPRPTACP